MMLIRRLGHWRLSGVSPKGSASAAGCKAAIGEARRDLLPAQTLARGLLAVLP